MATVENTALNERSYMQCYFSKIVSKNLCSIVKLQLYEEQSI